MWILFCGITKGQCISLKKFLSKSSSYLQSTTSKAKRAKMSVVSAIPPDIEIRQLLYLFQCFQEAQDDKVCET